MLTQEQNLLLTEVENQAPAGQLRQAVPASEWATGWSAVLVGTAGMALTGIAVYSMGLLMAPLQAQFGWSRTEVSSGFLVWALVSMCALPLMGQVIDRVGARAVAIPGTLLTGITFAALGLSNGSLPLWWALWTLFSFASAAANPTIWASAVSKSFVAGRGLAIGVMMCGTALSAMTIPSLTRWSIDSFGWRFAYLTVGAIYSIITLVLVLLFMRDGAQRRDSSTHGGPPAGASLNAVPGLSFRDAMRDASVLKILAATFLILVLIVAICVHFIPMMMEQKISRIAATAVVSGLGVGSIVGKLVVGWIADRSSRSLLPAIGFALPGVSCIVLLNLHGHMALAILAVTATGLASGSVLQLSAYLLSRYVGLRSFGRVYGIAAGLMALTGGIGPMLGGVVFDHWGSYSPLLLAGIPLSLCVGLLIGSLNSYPTFSRTS